MHVQDLAILATFLLLFGLISKRLESTFISAPMVFVALGWGLQALGIVELEVGSGTVQLIAELTLVVVLFTDASRINLVKLRGDHGIPVRLLSIGMPLTMLVGAGAAVFLLPDLHFWEALVLAIILAPTDAALGQSVVSSPAVPIRIRQAINVESGLNDGMALPILLFFLCLAGSNHRPEGAGYWLSFALAQILLGPVAGIAVGYFGGKSLTWATGRGWINPAFHQISGLSVALLAYAGGEWIGGNGFIGAFCAGLVLGNTSCRILPEIYEFGEAEGQLLSLFTFGFFGATMVPAALPYWDLSMWIYAGLSLTVIRLVPVSLSLIGLKLQPMTHAFLGWFGPRGIASILYGLIMMEEVQLDHGDTIFRIVVLTVLLSVVLHGISAWPATEAYGRRIRERMDSGTPEAAPIAKPLPLRHERAG